eukprot:CAMPEP_0174365032 /NCGR_PEP_ID=MMETSP0811_2-20130205/75565_1 /TAXON_ID=73025 ORGANISM="Eutreptiella gymnastica-like, Strain CCMP1594" /NCGR_SAMPLE_ID=MMETSP0811_2 /ASSEMBLY_ACC=CAM_ASM_000667 /LENGTH=79 /DNA_ID=CAMNT_0015505301 /DNA_START=85 /DNA_END=321 /DNA_ORIENTATION=+
MEHPMQSQDCGGVVVVGQGAAQWVGGEPSGEPGHDVTMTMPIRQHHDFGGCTQACFALPHRDITLAKLAARVQARNLGG